MTIGMLLGDGRAARIEARLSRIEQRLDTHATYHQDQADERLSAARTARLQLGGLLIASLASLGSLGTLLVTLSTNH